MPQKSLIPTVKKKKKKEPSNHLSTNQDAAHPGRCWFLHQSVQDGQEQQLLLLIINYYTEPSRATHEGGKKTRHVMEHLPESRELRMG